MEYTACFTGRSTRRILGEDIDLSGSLFRGSATAFAFGERDSPCADVPEKKKIRFYTELIQYVKNRSDLTDLGDFSVAGT